MLTSKLNPNSAWDVDFVVSYNEPYWPDAKNSDRDDARLGPLSNSEGLWLTATSYHRSMMVTPTLAGIELPRPTSGRQPNRILAGGLGPRDGNDFYWFVETMTTRDYVTALL